MTFIVELIVMSKSILITGASGMVAKASAGKLKDHGFTVIGVS